MWERNLAKSMRLWTALLLGLLVACGHNPSEPPIHALTFDFSESSQGWVAGFADYPAGSEALYELASAYKQLPPPLNVRGGLVISGNNHSDDLFMYIKRQVRGFEPTTSYRVTFTVEFATDVPSGCGGVGGSPGESVWVKAGASTNEPTSSVDQQGYRRMTIDKGNQSTSGKNAIAIGNVANSTLCEQNIRRYEVKQLRSSQPVIVTTDQTGAAWLLVGTDSGFEAVTTLYYTRIVAEFTKP